MSRITWIAIGLLIFISAVAQQRLLFLLGLILLLLAAASWLWARFCLAGVTYTRNFGQRRFFYGDDARMELEIVNAKPLPLAWLRIDDEFPLAMHPDYHSEIFRTTSQTADTSTRLSTGTGQNVSEPYSPTNKMPIDARQTSIRARRRLVNVLSMRWYEKVVRRYDIVGARRGIWHFGPAQLRSGDIFGFDIRRETHPRIDSLLVYPKVVPLHALGLPPGHPFGNFRSTRRIVEDPLRLMGTRAYAASDSYRHIHWKASARRQTLQTKVFEPSATRPVAIFLNLNTVTGPQAGYDPLLMEFAICAATSITREVWEGDQPVGLYANGMAVSHQVDAGGQRAMVGRVQVAPRAHPAQLVRILEALARIDVRGRWSFANMLQVERGNLAFGTTVVAITAVVDETLRGTLSELKRKGFPVVLITLGEAKLERPIAGVVEYFIGGHAEWAELEEIREV